MFSIHTFKCVWTIASSPSHGIAHSSIQTRDATVLRATRAIGPRRTGLIAVGTSLAAVGAPPARRASAGAARGTALGAVFARALFRAPAAVASLGTGEFAGGAVVRRFAAALSVDWNARSFALRSNDVAYHVYVVGSVAS
jgi:hypothetical protein